MFHCLFTIQILSEKFACTMRRYLERVRKDMLSLVHRHKGTSHQPATIRRNGRFTEDCTSRGIVIYSRKCVNQILIISNTVCIESINSLTQNIACSLLAGQRCVPLSVDQSEVNGVMGLFQDNVTVTCDLGHRANNQSSYVTTCTSDTSWSLTIPCSRKLKIAS